MAYVEQQRLLAGTPQTDQWFGWSVSIDEAGATAIAGAIQDNTNGTNAGAAYVFTRAGATWSEQQKILPVASTSQDKCGGAVSISGDGDTVAIGGAAPLKASNNEGAVWIWTRTAGVWSEQQKVQSSDKQALDNFGYSCALSGDGDTLVVGAPREDALALEAGAAYVFVRVAGVWTQQQKLTASVYVNSFYGWSVAISGDGETIIVGALGDDIGQTNAGAAYVYKRGAGFWTQEQRLESSDLAAGGDFGISVALDDSGDTAIVGDKLEDAGGSNAGAAYVFTRSAGVWTQQQKIVAGDPDDQDVFGEAVSLSGDGDTALVGASGDDVGFAGSGSAYLFTRSAGVWSQYQKINSSVPGLSYFFGNAVALSGNGYYGFCGERRAGNPLSGAGAAYVWYEAPVVFTGTPELPYEQESYAPTGQPELYFRQASVERATLELPFEQESHHPRGTPELPFRQASYVEGQPELPYRQASIDLPTGTGDPADATSSRWRLVVLLDGIDISASLTGDWNVDAGEGLARIAEFSMMPALGPIDPTTWVRKTVTLDYAETDNTGVVQWQVRLFTGIVDVPEYDPATRITRFSCTDRLQEILEQSDPAAIDSRIGGYWSEYVFDPEADGWQRARDRLSTVQASFDIDAGGTTRLTAWAAAASADYTYTAAGHIDDSVDLALANSRDMHNRVFIRFDFRFQRMRQRNVTRNWVMTPTIGCDFLLNPFRIPQRSMIQSAADATGWVVQAMSFVDLPPPQHFSCIPPGGGAPFVLGWGFKVIGNNSTVSDAESLLPLCQGAYMTLGKRWAQAVTEAYTIDLRAPQSIGEIGEIAREDFGGLEARQETDAWESETDYTAPAIGAGIHRNGDYVVDADQGVDDGRSAMETAIQTLQAVHRTAILASHRLNRVSWRTLIQPQLALRHTARLQTDALTAKGKVARLVHAGSIDTGEATTEITLALSRSSATGALGDDPLDPPPAPDSQVDPVADPTSPLIYGANGTHIGGTTTAPAFDEDWHGFVTNYQWDPSIGDRFATDPDLPQTVLYPVQFRVPVTEIEEAARQATEAQQTQIINIDIPLDELQAG